MAQFQVALNQDSNQLTAAAVSSTSSTITLVASATGQIIRCYKIILVAGGTTNITFEDGSNPLSGAIPLVANAGFILAFDTQPWFMTSPGNALNLGNSGSSVQISGTIWFTQG